MIRTLVLIYQSIFMAIGQIWSNKVRSILTTVGIVIGVAAVVAVVAALTGMRRYVLNEFEGVGTDKLWAFPQIPEGQRHTPGWRQRIKFDPHLFDDVLRYAPSIRAFTRVDDDQLTVRSDTQSADDVSLTAIDRDWHLIQRRYVTMGRPFSLVDMEQARPVCLINKKLQDKLWLDRDPTGQQILIGSRRYTIVGIVEERKDTFFGFNTEGTEVIIPFTTRLREEPNLFFHVEAAAVSTDLAPEAAAELTFFLRSRRGIGPLDPPNFGVEYLSSIVDSFNNMATGISVLATGVVAISLAVGGVGIMNIMLVSVSERTREIGLRKAVGARPAAILFQFLIEAVVLCSMGGLIGILIGWGIASGLKGIDQLRDAYVPTWAVALAFLFSAGVGVIFGMFPAIKASRLDPIDALRHE